MRADLSRFRSHAGKLIVPHGMADPVFSPLDTISWWNALNEREKGRAADFARVFPVPGMNHCGGGDSTDRFDSLGALEDWVLKNKAPDEIPARADEKSVLAGREMPLCPWPQVALRDNSGTYRCGNMPSPVSGKSRATKGPTDR
jgi:feruloyl esterase